MYNKNDDQIFVAPLHTSLVPNPSHILFVFQLFLHITTVFQKPAVNFTKFVQTHTQTKHLSNSGIRHPIKLLNTSPFPDDNDDHVCWWAIWHISFHQKSFTFHNIHIQFLSSTHITQKKYMTWAVVIFVFSFSLTKAYYYYTGRKKSTRRQYNRYQISADYFLIPLLLLLASLHIVVMMMVIIASMKRTETTCHTHLLLRQHTNKVTTLMMTFCLEWESLSYCYYCFSYYYCQSWYECNYNNGRSSSSSSSFFRCSFKLLIAERTKNLCVEMSVYKNAYIRYSFILYKVMWKWDGYLRYFIDEDFFFISSTRENLFKSLRRTTRPQNCNQTVIEKQINRFICVMSMSSIPCT